MRIVRILSTLAVLGALAWTGWWYALSRGQEAALEAWFDDRSRAGWQAEYTEIGLTGFPTQLKRRVTDIRLADPKTGWAWSAPWLEFASATHSPNRVEVVWPTEQALAVPGEWTEITSGTMTASMGLHADTDLGLIDTSALIAGLTVKARSGWTAKAGNVSAQVAERVNDDGYAIEFMAEKVMMPEHWMARIDPTGLAGRELERMTFDGSVAFGAPLDRHVIEDGRLALNVAVIRRAGLQWGQIRMDAKGKIKADDRGYAKGKIDLTMRHWRQLVAMAQRSGMISARVADGLVTALELVALLSGNRDELDATLTFADGRIWIGPVSIGDAPRLAPPRG